MFDRDAYIRDNFASKILVSFTSIEEVVSKGTYNKNKN